MRRLPVLLLVLFSFVTCLRPAEALSLRDIVELSRAGLGDDVLLALVEVNRGVYAIDSETLKRLKAAGVSDRVIVALVRSGRELPEPAGPAVAEPEPYPPSPQVVVIEHHTPARVVEVPVPVPVYVTVPAAYPRLRHRSRPVATESTYVPFQSGPPPVRAPVQEPGGRPEYWGFGGKLRPDAWTPAGHRREQGAPETAKPEQKPERERDAARK